MKDHVFVGFGFGPIQSGLFVAEAFKSGNFKRIVIAEIDQKLVDAIRVNNGSYWINIASSNGITAERIDGIEIYNPTVGADRHELLKVLSQATEIVTSLPSVDFYDMGQHSVASLIQSGLKHSTVPATIIYTAENNNHAAEILEEKVGTFENIQFLNTVIGKMSQVLNDSDEVADNNLRSIAPGVDRAFLVEEFNNILVSKCNIPNIKPGIGVFFEKQDLLPFEEVKLYGHNAIHALLAYLGAAKGYLKMAELKKDEEIMRIARDAFIHESGTALIKKYADLNDELFTEQGYKAFAEDLLERMTNPYLNDPIERAARDPIRKLGLKDRLFGTMTLCLEQGIEPANLASGAASGMAYLLNNAQCYDVPGYLCENRNIKELLAWLWKGDSNTYVEKLIEMCSEILFSHEKR